MNVNNLLDKMMAKVEKKKIPLWAHLDVTYGCNLNCIHCYCRGLSPDFTHNRSEMDTQEIKILIDGLAEAGSLYLTLSGGEVFTRRDFFEIAFYAKKKHFALKVFTNGMLVNEDIAGKLEELSPLSVDMSIYGVTAEVHDTVTQMPGSLNKLMETVKLLKKHNLNVVLKSTLMKPNYHQYQELSKFSLDIGGDEYHFGIEVTPKNDGSRAPMKYQLDEKEINFILSRAIKHPIEKHEYWNDPLSKPLCGTGMIGCYISPYGDVYPCIQLLALMGNIRKKGFRDIWYESSDLRSKLNQLHTYKDLTLCRSCEYVRVCKKCIGIAYLEKKDMMACYNTLRDISKISYELTLDKE